MDSIRPLQNYEGSIVPQAVLNGTLGTVVYASNYNDLDNKPSINSVELRGNKTAEDLGLATPADITVTSVNTQTGDVSLTGQNIPYDSTYSVTEKINDLESQIVDSGVSSVNGHTGAVILTGSDINYSVGVSLNAKIDAVEGEIPVVNYPVTSVNGETGAVVLAGSDIEYSAGVSLTDKIDAVEGEIPVVDYPVTSVNEKTGAVDLTGADIAMSGSDSTLVSTAIGSLSQLTTTDKSSLVGAVNELAPTAYAQATRSSALSSGALGFVKIGKVVIANLNYTTNTSNVSTHDTVLYSDLPPSISNIYLNFVDEVGNVTRVRVGTDGKMHLHYSTITANKEINGSFVYLSA